MNLRLSIKDETAYEGPAIAIPRVGDDIHQNGQIVRVEAVVWDFGASDVVAVSLILGDRPYTY
jgi:hypothetical protein